MFFQHDTTTYQQQHKNRKYNKESSPCDLLLNEDEFGVYSSPDIEISCIEENIRDNWWFLIVEDHVDRCVDL